MTIFEEARATMTAMETILEQTSFLERGKKILEDEKTMLYAQNEEGERINITALWVSGHFDNYNEMILHEIKEKLDVKEAELGLLMGRQKNAEVAPVQPNEESTKEIKKKSNAMQSKNMKVKKNFPTDEIQKLLEQGKNYKQIADKYGCSATTMRKFAKENGLAKTDDKKTNTRCSECDYSTHNSGTWMCNYLLVEKKMRGCEAENCDKFVNTGKKRYVGEDDENLIAEEFMG